MPVIVGLVVAPRRFHVDRQAARLHRHLEPEHLISVVRVNTSHGVTVGRAPAVGGKPIANRPFSHGMSQYRVLLVRSRPRYVAFAVGAHRSPTDVASLTASASDSECVSNAAA